MVKIALVDVRLGEGERLIDALNAGSMQVISAFWGKLSEGQNWYLHIISPFVDQHGSTEAYGIVNDVMKKAAIQWIDPFQIKVLRTDDSLTDAALAKLKSRMRGGTFATQGPAASTGMVTFEDCTLGGYEFDEVLIYPPRQPQSTP